MNRIGKFKGVKACEDQRPSGHVWRTVVALWAQGRGAVCTDHQAPPGKMSGAKPGPCSAWVSPLWVEILQPRGDIFYNFPNAQFM